MNLKDYIGHYFSFPGFFYFFIISLLVVCGIHAILLFKAQKGPRGKYGETPYQEFKSLKEQYYELLFSSTSMLFFTGIYFIIDFRWIPMSDTMVAFWERYSNFILLGLMILSIVIINILDNVLIPLKKLGPQAIGYLRMASMIYMLLLFAYIKFIYADDNYDAIVFYFITMLISRFVYVDASLVAFRDAAKGLVRTLQILLLVLLSTALLALYGFRSGYLLTSNSVAVSLCIAHCFVIFECFLLTVTGLANRFAKKILKQTDTKS